MKILKAIEIINTMEKWAKSKLIDEWDNTGFQIGNPNKEIKSILVSLDLDEKILDLAIKENYDMIITHHPLIFSPLKTITSNNPKEKLILDIIKQDIIVYNAHSNLDLAIGGVNDVLADLLDMKNKKPLHRIDKRVEIYGYGRYGNIEKTSILELGDKIKEKLNIDNLNIYGDIDRDIDTIAVCGGSGSDFISDAFGVGAQCYITGDIKYHEAQMAYELGITLIDPGHFHSEKIILPEIKKYLDQELEKKLNIDIIMESSLPHIVY